MKLIKIMDDSNEDFFMCVYGIWMIDVNIFQYF
jgi:hypothetical protein